MPKLYSRENDQFEELIQGLIDKQYGCCNDFLQADTLFGLRENMFNFKAEGELNLAGISNQSNFHKNDLIRSDKVRWIMDDSKNINELIYLQKVKRFMDYLNKSCFTSVKKMECHYANFEVGSFYKRHLDQFKTDHGRKFSIILYLNQDWKQEDEGLLALYPTQSQPTTISPTEGRLVFFRSDEMEHEVHPSTTRDRYSIAGWLKN